MNERIKLLKEQSMEWVPNMADPDTKIRLLNAEKFAELIVRECVGILSANENTKIKMGLDEPLFKLFKGIGKAYADGIKEHFGVEE
jgi:hypothetical protein